MFHSYSFLLTLLVTLATLQANRAIDFTVTNRATSSRGGARFDAEIGAAYAEQTLATATEFTWRLFQQANEVDRKPVQQVTLFIDDKMDNDDQSYAENNEIHVSANYIATYSGDLKREITGIIYHELTHVLQSNGNGQAPDGLIEGIADFVRLQANYAPNNWVRPGSGTKWDQGHDVTARFLDYVNGLKNGFVAELNKKMKNGYSDQYFVDILGKSVDQLWREYKVKYAN